MASLINKLKKEFPELYSKVINNSELNALIEFLYYPDVKNKFWMEISRFKECEESYFDEFGKIAPMDWDHILKTKRLSSTFRQKYRIELLTRKNILIDEKTNCDIPKEPQETSFDIISEKELLERVSMWGWKVVSTDYILSKSLIDRYKNKIFLSKQILKTRFQNLNETQIFEGIFNKRNAQIDTILKRKKLLCEDTKEIKNYNLLTFMLLIPKEISLKNIERLLNNFEEKPTFEPISFQDIKSFKNILESYKESTQITLLSTYGESQNIIWELCILHKQCMEFPDFELPTQIESIDELYKYIIKYVRTEHFVDFDLDLIKKFLFLKKFQGKKFGEYEFRIPITALELCLWGDEVKLEFTPNLEHIKSSDYIILGVFKNDNLNKIIQLSRKGQLTEIYYSEEQIRVNSKGWKELEEAINMTFNGNKLKGYY